ncbi:MAG: sigma 54-interacting transcriptional regulator [Alphaproteobacteria bacterium]|jgi:two-component system response regulator FlrC
MSTIRLEHDKFASADRLASIFQDRLLTVASPNGDLAGDPKSSIYICSAAYEASIGGEAEIIAKGRAARAGSMMIIEENADSFALTETLGGKLIRLALPAALDASTADDYGLQLAATLVSDGRAVACGDKVSRDLLALARRVAQTDVTVFINGPTGTGKEVLAKFIHNHSERSEAPFVAVNCAAIPDNMLEAILFGHEKGAFTGASTANKGIFRAADGGTLLLDEISEMPMALQAKLLRALQERAVTPIGSQTDIPVDVRVVATTNRNMAEEIRAGHFREDLYYRLNVFPLNTVALAARPDDIVPVATFLLNRHIKTTSDLPWLADDAIEALRRYGWPGNVRELENVLQRALVLARDGVVSASEILIDDVLARRPDELPNSMAAAFRQSAAEA